MSGGLDFGLMSQPDRSIISGSIPVATDASVIINAVAEADIQPGPVQHVPWSNGNTGNFGTISYIRESSSVGTICRDFIVSKQSYDGISQFTGEICRKRLGKSWSIKSLNEQT